MPRTDRPKTKTAERGAARTSRRPAGKSPRPAKGGKAAEFLQKETCETCRKARTFMKRRGYKLRVRDLQKHPLSAAELEKLIGSRDHTEFLNPRSATYREQNMKEEPPPRKEAIRLMAREPNLIRRPIVLVGGRVVIGFDEKGRVHF